ncbi:serine/threonine-protein phosphatase 6 regulatory subunit 3-like isoform X2 [Rhopilema esculentum]|uniref:serine/threonine-protein phosphatase 6 regulatory subunit 3-like isoform X2 n=1 Tax=Rhopilema esculentum TaxID=499914 RepID=UPI0031E07D44
MFWKFHLGSSGLDTLLAKEDVTLKEVLDEEDVLQECKTQNSKLIEFLSKDDVLRDLLDLAITEPPEDGDLKTQFKYPNLACEVICTDIDAIIEKLVCEKSLLEKLWAFLDQDPPLNPLIASFFAKIVGSILMKKGTEVFEYVKEHDVIDKLLNHLEVSAMMEVFVKLMSIVDSSEMKTKMENLLEEQELVQKLIMRLGPQYSHEMHSNSSNLLIELIRMGREAPSQVPDPEDQSGLFSVVEREDVLSDLIDRILSDRGSPNADSSLVNGMDVLLSLIEFKRPNPEGLEELFTPVSAEKIAQGIQSALKALKSRLKDFHALLVEPPPQSPMLSTVGTLDPPLGRVRLHVAWLISALVATSSPDVNSELTELGTLNVLLDLFFDYQWNNFLHTYVEHCISSILCSNTEDESNPLLTHLLSDCSLITKIITAWEENEARQLLPGGQRRGYMGHLTRIANSLAANMEKGPNCELLQSLFNDLPEEARSSWKELVEGALNDVNVKNTTQMQFSSPMMHSSSEDDDDGTFKSVPILQYENSLQQVQQMSAEFIETFGHNEDDLNEIGKSDNPFDEIGNVDFSINANEETPDAQLFEAVCNEKIRQFDDSGSDEECFGSSQWGNDSIDVWEEKELKYSPKANMKRRPAESNSDESDNSSDESASSSDEEAVFADEVKRNSPLITAKSENKDTKQTDENMDIEARYFASTLLQSLLEWTATFEGEAVAMDTLDAAAVGWVDSEATSVVDVADEQGFADFTDITKFSCDEDADNVKAGPESPVAMDEDSSDAFRLESSKKSEDKAENEDDKMEEDVSEAEKPDDKTSPNSKGDIPRIETTLNPETEDSNEPSKQMEKDVESNSGTKDENKQSNSKNVKVDVVESGDDPMRVTSQVVGGFVVIDASVPEVEKENRNELPAAKPNQEVMSSKKEAHSPSKSGVSVVTVSSCCLNWRSFYSNNRQVINISSDGTVESPRSPRSPKKSKSPSKPRSPRSPRSLKSTESSQRLSPRQLDTKSSEVSEQSEVNAEATTNGPVLTLEDNGNSENSETSKDSLTTSRCESSNVES